MDVSEAIRGDRKRKISKDNLLISGQKKIKTVSDIMIEESMQIER